MVFVECNVLPCPLRQEVFSIVVKNHHYTMGPHENELRCPRFNHENMSV